MSKLTKITKKRFVISKSLIKMSDGAFFAISQDGYSLWMPPGAVNEAS